MTEKAGKKSTPAQSAPKYPYDELVLHAQALFGVRSEVIQGALYGKEKAELTKEEVRLLINQFQRKKVN